MYIEFQDVEVEKLSLLVW